MTHITERTVMLYRDVLLRTPDGREVLKDILNDLYAFAHGLEDDEQRVLHSAALNIQAKLGILLPGSIESLIEAWSTIPPPKEITNNGSGT